ncbi:MAG TPA: EAL domain-containing protein [Dissulfurispiraceae bacterium]|nr:EAL domain-containing protein [Dissulfurispiraceae bacterium]
MKARSLREPSVLIVDDDNAIRQIARLTLEMSEFSVLEVSNGFQAVLLLKEQKPDIILLDVMLPGLDGIAVCRELRKMPGGERIPVLMLTGHDDLDSITKAYEAGATDFVTKPVNWVILAHRLMYMVRAGDTFDDLIASETKNRALLHAIPDVMFRMDRSGLVLDYKEAPDLDLPLQTDSVLGSRISDVLPAELVSRMQEAMEGAFKTGDTQIFEYQASIKNTERYFEFRVVAYGEDAALVLIRDITQRKNAEYDIRYMAYHDSLTRLPNIQLFRDHLGLSLTVASNSGNYVAVLFIDLDRFKFVNDKYGHKIGDLLLQASADRIVNGMRRGDIVAHVGSDQVRDMVARMGGDEFTILLPNIKKPEDVAKISKRVLEELARPFVIFSTELNITASIGIAIYPHDGSDIDSLLQNADTAMYHAKAKGRNNFQFFNESMNLHIKERLSIEGKIRKALEEKEFVLNYLPRYDMHSGRILGAEALLRWTPQDLLNLPVEQVISIAGEIGISGKLGDWVLGTACSQAAEWSREDPSSCVSVNLSIHEFKSSGLISKIKKLTEDLGLKPCCLELEITETTIMQDVAATAVILKNLKDLGMKLSIDDFGMGYSSLSSLRRFPLDSLKIAQALTKDLPGSQDSAAIVKAIIGLARAMSLKIIAEGVENEEQYRFLKENGCDEFQGFIYGPAVSAQEITSLLVKQKGRHTGI